jgi:hypothetical protein
MHLTEGLGSLEDVVSEPSNLLSIEWSKTASNYHPLKSEIQLITGAPTRRAQSTPGMHHLPSFTSLNHHQSLLGSLNSIDFNRIGLTNEPRTFYLLVQFSESGALWSVSLPCPPRPREESRIWCGQGRRVGVCVALSKGTPCG